MSKKIQLKEAFKHDDCKHITRRYGINWEKAPIMGECKYSKYAFVLDSPNICEKFEIANEKM